MAALMAPADQQPDFPLPESARKGSSSSSSTHSPPSPQPQKSSPAAFSPAPPARPSRASFLANRLLPRLAFPDPATERAFQSYSATHRPIRDSVGVLLVTLLIIPVIAPRTASYYACCAPRSEGPAVCPNLLASPAPAQQLLASFPCASSWAQQLLWWLQNVPQAYYWVLLQPNVLEFGSGLFCLVLLLMITPLSGHPGYYWLRTPVVIAVRIAEFMLSAAAVLAKEPHEPSFADVHFCRQTLWGASVLLWHGLLHSVPFDLHVRLAPLEWASVAICVFCRNRDLLSPPALVPILLAQVLLGVVLPTFLLYLIESFQRRQFLLLQQQAQAQQHSLQLCAGVGLQPACQLASGASSKAGRPATVKPPQSAVPQASLQQQRDASLRRESATAGAGNGLRGAASSGSVQPSTVSGRVAQRRLGRLHYAPVTSRVLISAKILDAPPQLEADPAPLVHALQRTLRASASQQPTPLLLTMQHAVIKGCIQVLLWVNSSQPLAAAPAAGSPPPLDPAVGDAAAAAVGALGGVGISNSQIVTTIQAVCADAWSAAGSKGEPHVQPAVSVTVQQLFVACSVSTPSKQLGNKLAWPFLAGLFGMFSSHSTGKPVPAALPSPSEAQADASQPAAAAAAAATSAPQSHALAGAEFWVQGGFVCCSSKHDELLVQFALRGAAGDPVEAVRGVLVDMAGGSLLLDAALEVEFQAQDAGAAAGVLRLPIDNAELPSTPTPLQLLLLPANDTQGAVLWSCPLLASMPPAIATELHSLFPSMLAAMSEPEPAAPACAVQASVPSAALEAEVFHESYLPFISELCMAAWPPTQDAAALAEHTAADSAAAASIAKQQQQERSELLDHLAEYLQSNALPATLGWLQQQLASNSEPPATPTPEPSAPSPSAPSDAIPDSPTKLSKSSKTAPAPPPAAPHPTPRTVAKAVLLNSFPDPSLERQYRKYHLVQTATLDRQGGALQLLVNLAHVYKATSQLEVVLMSLLFLGHLVLYPVLVVPHWRLALPRRGVMLALQLTVLLPPGAWCLLRQPFPDAYVLLWRDSPHVTWLHAIMVSALVYQVGLWQTTSWCLLYATLIWNLVPFKSAASAAVTLGVLVVAPSAAAAAVDYLHRRSFLRRLHSSANQQS